MFEIGDKARCVNNVDPFGDVLTVGKIYEVLEVKRNGDVIRTTTDSAYRFLYRAFLFEKVEADEIMIGNSDLSKIDKKDSENS